MTWPTSLTVSAAFGIDPLTTPAGGDWTDLTAYVRSVDVKRGRNHELSRTAAGTMSVRLRNTDRRFDPKNTAGPYYPNVRPMTRMRFRVVHSAVTYDLFTGYVEDWGQQWSPRPIDSTGDAEVSVKVADAFKLLSLIELDPLHLTVGESGPIGYWKMDDPAGSPVAASSGSVEGAEAVYDIAPGETVDRGSTFTGPIEGGQLIVDWANGSSSEAVTASLPDFLLQGDMSVEFWFKPDHSPVYQTTVIGTAVSPFPLAVGESFQVMVDVVEKWEWVYSLPVGWQAVQFSTGPVVGSWHHYAFVRVGTTQVLYYLDGVLMETVALPSAPGAVQAPVRIGPMEPAQIAHVAVFDRALGEEEVLDHASARYERFAAGPAGAHIGLILDMIGWPAGERDLSTGIELQETTPSGSALEWLLHVAEDTENGLLHVTGDGKIRFHDRDDLLGHVTSSATIGDNAADGVVYSDLEARYDDQDLFTEVVAQREGGAAVHASDATAQADYGPRVLVRPISLAANDNDSRSVAEYLLGRYKAPELRFEGLTLVPGTTDARWVQALARDIHADRVTVKRRPPGGGSAISLDAHVEGLEHSYAPPRRWATSWDLVPSDVLTYWILADSTYGVLGTTTRLGY